MDYAFVYQCIIDRARMEVRTPNGHERHHIVPKCLGGSNRKDNLVLLTCKEHFVCHLLLTKMFVGEARKKMCWALHRMSYGKDRRLTAYEYAMVRHTHVANMSVPKSAKTRERMRGPKTPAHASNISAGVKEAWTRRSRTRSDATTTKWIHTMKERFPDGVSAGVSPTPQTREKISASLRGRTASAETREKLSEARMGQRNPNFGKTHSEETRAKMRAAWERRRAATQQARK